MKTFLLFCLFLIPALSQAQHKKQGGYFSFAGSVNIPTTAGMDPIMGAELSGNAELGKGGYLGLQAGVLKFQGMMGVYVPIQLKFSLMPAKNPKKVSPLIVLAPGLGVYNQTDTQGGFTFYGGIGAVFAGKGKSGGYLTAGYSSYGFTSGDINSTVETIGIRAGIMIQ